MTMRTEQLRYCILDPTGNITALVESPVEEKDQPAAASRIMQRHPSVEQVGFVRYNEDDPVHLRMAGDEFVPVCLRMAGGEFCGNASMSAAALFLFRHSPYSPAVLSSTEKMSVPEASCSGLSASDASDFRVSNPGVSYPGASYSGASEPAASDPDPSELESLAPEALVSSRQTILLRVSGTPDPVKVSLKRKSETLFEGCITMPPALNTEVHPFTFGTLSGMLPLVHMEGISHLIIEPDSVFFSLKDKRPDAETAIRTWCHALKAKGLGLMFLDRRSSVPTLIPLVYIPGGNTVFWENSCASGTSATAMYLARKTAASLSLSLQEPGGILQVESDPAPGGETRLHGQVRILSLHS